MQFNYTTQNCRNSSPSLNADHWSLVHQVAVNEDIAFMFVTAKRAGITQIF
jgi:hypothetical protein